MYAGHLALGLFAKSREPEVPLAVFLVASVATDLLVASVFHTIPAVAVTAVVLGALGARWYGRRAGGWLVLLVIAHFVGDLITSSLALWPNGPTAGLRLYDQPAADFALEAALIIGGWIAWRRSLPAPRSRDAWSMVVLLLFVQLVFDVFVARTANGR